MKKICFLLFIVLNVTVNCQWQSQNIGLNDYVLSVFFTDSLHGFLGDATGRISRTTDGGISWHLSDYIASGALKYGCPAGGSNAFFVGDYGIIIKTTDNGLSWQSKNSGTNALLVQAHFPTPETGFAVGDGSTILKTTNGGENWTSICNSVVADFRAVYFISRMTGWVTGFNGKILKTTNGGETWSETEGMPNQSIRAVKFISDNVGFAAGNWGLMYKTTNQGESWNQISVPTDQVMNYLFFFDELRGYAVGIYGTIIATSDGGNTWMAQNSNTSTQHLFSVWFLTADKGFCAGGSEGGGPYFIKTNNGGYPLPYLSVSSPNGGENWPAGTQKIIKWNGFGSQSLKIDYTSNNGVDWFNITENVSSAARQYIWNVPNGFKPDCKVRITDLVNPSITDISDAGFSITTINITAPSANSYWPVFSNQNIVWGTFGVNKVNIKYSSGSFSEWEHIADTVTNSGSYLWQVPEMPGYYCKIKIEDAADIRNCFITDQFLIRYYYSPVELSSFDASVNENDVILSWSTATESNNRGFNIERAYQSGPWLTVGFKQGKGTSLSTVNYSYNDKDLPSGDYRYRLKQIDFNGNFEYSSITDAFIAPVNCSLEQNYPNPFNPSTGIKYSVAAESFVTIKIYNVLGKQISVLVNEVKEPGSYTLNFNGNNLPSGVYFCKMEAGSFSSTRKMVLLR